LVELLGEPEENSLRSFRGDLVWAKSGESLPSLGFWKTRMRIRAKDPQSLGCREVVPLMGSTNLGGRGGSLSTWFAMPCACIC
jgi:hypothetical protein